MERSRRSLLRTLIAVGSTGIAGCSALGGRSTRRPPSSKSTERRSPTGTDDGGSAPTTASPDGIPNSPADPSPTGPSTSADGARVDTRTEPGPTDSGTPREPTDSGTPAALPFRLETTVTAPEPTRKHPPTFELRITNTDEQPHSLRTPTWTFPFVRLGPAEDSLVVLENADWGLTPPSQGDVDCWKVPLVPVSPTSRARRFEPGESFTKEYLVLNYVGEMDEPAACWPPGTYAFRYEFRLDAPSRNAPESNPFVWRLTVRVDDTPSVSVASAGLSWGSLR